MMLESQDDNSGKLRSVNLIGTGSYVPKKTLTNADLEEIVDTSDDWIYSRTGMKERRIAAEDEASSDMGTVAAKRAIEDAGIAPDEIDLILVATCTPDMPFPNTASIIQHAVGAKNAFCMDIAAACSGFMYAMDVARQYVRSGGAKTVLVVGAEKMSGLLNWEDRTTCVLFGDGAGAAILRAGGESRGILTSILGTDGSLTDLLKVPAGGSRQPIDANAIEQRDQFIRMKGREVFKYAVTNMSAAVQTALDQAGLTAAEISCVIPHQANARIIKAIGDRVGIENGAVFMNVEKYGNTSAASIGIALDEARRSGRVTKGDFIMLVAFGAGFTWGAMLLEL